MKDWLAVRTTVTLVFSSLIVSMFSIETCMARILRLQRGISWHRVDVHPTCDLERLQDHLSSPRTTADALQRSTEKSVCMPGRSRQASECADIRLIALSCTSAVCDAGRYGDPDLWREGQRNRPASTGSTSSPAQNRGFVAEGLCISTCVEQVDFLRYPKAKDMEVGLRRVVRLRFSTNTDSRVTRKPTHLQEVTFGRKVDLHELSRLPCQPNIAAF